jgi:hypothetical protein
MTALGQLLDEVARRDIQVTWSSTLDTPGLLIPSHSLLVLSADRCESVLIDAIIHALRELPAAAAS